MYIHCILILVNLIYIRIIFCKLVFSKYHNVALFCKFRYMQGNSFIYLNITIEYRSILYELQYRISPKLTK